MFFSSKLVYLNLVKQYLLPKSKFVLVQQIIKMGEHCMGIWCFASVFGCEIPDVNHLCLEICNFDCVCERKSAFELCIQRKERNEKPLHYFFAN